MRSLILLVFLLFSVPSMAQDAYLSEPTRKYILDVIGRALKEEDPVVRQALIASIGFPHMPNQGGRHVSYAELVVYGLLWLLLGLTCLYALFHYNKYVFQKRGIEQRYKHWTAARDMREEQEEYLFKQAEKHNKAD